MNRPLTALFLLGIATGASAQTTYYVDAVGGDDNNKTGTFPAPNMQSADGPWRSISKVNAGTFLPGDSIRFKCGGVWREQLVISASGNVGAPITFGSYGTCDGSNKPTISGAAQLSGWSVYSGKIYVADATPAINLLKNGYFDTDVSGWLAWSNDNSAQKSWQANTNAVGGSAKFTASPNAVSTHNFLSSNNFTVEKGKSYSLEFTISGGSNQYIAMNVRRNGIPDYNPIGITQKITVGTTPQKFNYVFVATSTEINNARLDFDVAPGQLITLDSVSIREVLPAFDNVEQVFVDGKYVNLAHYPNAGYLPQEPTNTFLKIASNSTLANGSTGSNYLQGGSDLVLASQDIAGAGIHIRTNSWDIADRQVTAYNAASKTFSLNTPTTYPLVAGWGYYLDNKLWMLDQPGEWYFDRVQHKFYLWMPDSSAPNLRAEAGYLSSGIYAKARSNIVIDGLAITKSGTGIELTQSANVTLQNTDVTDSSTAGIDAKWSSAAVIDHCSVKNSVHDGIRVTDATNATITNNTVQNSGNVGTPKWTLAAIRTTGTSNALIRNNMVTNSGYHGIMFGTASTVNNNLVENACLVLDDCGGIYSGGLLTGSTVTDNVIINVTGNPNGRLATRNSAAQGIYLDEFASGVSVARNTVVKADFGIQLHKAHDNILENNTFYDARNSAAWVQESVTPGSSYNNAFHFNKFFMTNANVPLVMMSNFSSINLATFDFNRYSGIYANSLVRESYWPNGVYTATSYELQPWRNVRMQDFNSSLFKTFSIAPSRVSSVSPVNLVVNSTFSTDVSSWNEYNGTKSWVASCVVGGCMQFTNTQAGGLIQTGSFSIQQGVTYLLKFDGRAMQGTQNIPVAVRRAGAPNFDAVGLEAGFQFGTNWQTYSMVFTATETRTFSSTVSGSGVRLYIAAPSGQTIYLDNVNLQAATVEKNTTTVTNNSSILINKTLVTSTEACPDLATNPAQCSQYVNFSDGNPVVWPITLAPMSSEIVILANSAWKDSDGDGVPDNYDACPNTPLGTPTDERGCSFLQNHP